MNLVKKSDGASSPETKVEAAVSAGGVVLRPGERGLDVLLCGRAQPPLWALPKGAPNPGEGLEEAALREVAEETGMEAVIQGKVGSISYWFSRPEGGVRYHKTVHFFLMAPVGGSPDRHDTEFDFVRWFPLEEAFRAMTYANEGEMVRLAAEMAVKEEA